MNILFYIVAAAVGYLSGSIPFGYILIRLFTGEDVRNSGSGNIGATNVARRSPGLGIATLCLDALKGSFAVLVVHRLFAGEQQHLIMMVASFFAVLGHLFPVWLKFRGGKGVATSLGAFVLLTPKSILCMVGLFLLVTAAFRYVSLGSVVAAATFPLFALTFHEFNGSRELLMIATVSALVIWKHRQNVIRLFSGTESKLGAKKTADPISGLGKDTRPIGARRQ